MLRRHARSIAQTCTRLQLRTAKYLLKVPGSIDLHFDPRRSACVWPLPLIQKLSENLLAQFSARFRSPLKASNPVQRAKEVRGERLMTILAPRYAHSVPDFRLTRDLKSCSITDMLLLLMSPYGVSCQPLLQVLLVILVICQDTNDDGFSNFPSHLQPSGPALASTRHVLLPSCPTPHLPNTPRQVCPPKTLLSPLLNHYAIIALTLLQRSPTYSSSSNAHAIPTHIPFSVLICPIDSYLGDSQSGDSHLGHPTA